MQNTYPIEEYVDECSDKLNILIFIVDKCNFSCEYCYNRFPRTNKELNIDVCTRFIQDISNKTKKNLNISLIGGEPTLHSKCSQLIDNISSIDKNITIELLTNFSLPLQYYYDVLKKNVKLAASWHGGFDNTNLTYVKNMMKIPIDFFEKDMIEVRIMFEYDNWESSDKVFKLLYPKYKKWMEISLLTRNDGTSYPYTENQIKTYRDYVKKLKYTREFFTLRYSDGSKRLVSFNDMYLNPSINFKLWRCNAGLDYIYVHVDGNVFNCQSYYEHGMKPICNIYETNGVYKKELFKPCICRVDYCSCDFDVHKEKILKGCKK